MWSAVKKKDMNLSSMPLNNGKQIILWVYIEFYILPKIG